MNFDDPVERAALTGEYVLGQLSPGDQAEFEREFARNPELARAVAAWHERLLPLALSVKPHPPPDELWPRIERDIVAGVSSRAPKSSGIWSNLAFWRVATGVSMAAALALAWIVLVAGPVLPTQQYVAVLQSPTDRSAGWIVETGARDSVRLTPLLPTPVGSGQALQFWTKPDGAAGPTSLGLVPADRPTIVPGSRLPGLSPNQLFEITLEPAGGSRIGRPTGPILFVGRAVKV